MNESAHQLDTGIFNETLATWNRPRTSEELQEFIDRKHAALDQYDDIDI